MPRNRRKGLEEEEGPGDFSVDEKTRQVSLTEAGHENAERLLSEAGLLDEDQALRCWQHQSHASPLCGPARALSLSATWITS